jgi:hypothetical protein
VVMRTLATLGLESLLIELDEARGAHYELDEADESRAGRLPPRPLRSQGLDSSGHRVPRLPGGPSV